MSAMQHGLTPPPTRPWQSLGLALLLETVGLAAVIGLLANEADKVRRFETPIDIVAEAPPAPPEPTPPQPEPPKPQPTPVHPKQVTPTPPTPTPPVPVEQPVAQLPVEAPATPVPPQMAVPSALPPKPAAPPAPPPGPPGPSAEYIAQVRAAVQQAFVYPAAAKALDFHGRTRVAFKLLDAHPLGAHVLIPSGMGLVDKAALAAVQGASFPAPPAELHGHELSFEVWVEFRS